MQCLLLQPPSQNHRPRPMFGLSGTAKPHYKPSVHQKSIKIDGDYPSKCQIQDQTQAPLLVDQSQSLNTKPRHNAAPSKPVPTTATSQVFVNHVRQRRNCKDDQSPFLSSPYQSPQTMDKFPLARTTQQHNTYPTPTSSSISLLSAALLCFLHRNAKYNVWIERMSNPLQDMLISMTLQNRKSGTSIVIFLLILCRLLHLFVRLLSPKVGRHMH